MKIIKSFALALCLALLAINTAQAVVPAGVAVTAKASGMIAGGSNVSLTWTAPAAASYKVWLNVPKGSKATNALYRVYPKGNLVGNTLCSPTDATYPCFEIPVNQALKQNTWVQLTANTTTQWAFVKGGYVTINPFKLPISESLGVSSVRFEAIIPPTIYPSTGYSKISNNGVLLGDSAVLGTGVNAWACTRDNVTGLFWEVKTTDLGLRDKDNTYSWYDSNTGTNGGNSGVQNKGSCTIGSCDTEGYVNAVNAIKLCGFSDWRVPSYAHLKTLSKSSYPYIDKTYFPTSGSWLWSSSTTNDSSYAWVVAYGTGYSSSKSYNDNKAQLVRGGQ